MSRTTLLTIAVAGVASLLLAPPGGANGASPASINHPLSR
jgi:hypothetical protein